MTDWSWLDRPTYPRMRRGAEDVQVGDIVLRTDYGWFLIGQAGALYRNPWRAWWDWLRRQVSMNWPDAL